MTITNVNYTYGGIGQLQTARAEGEVDYASISGGGIITLGGTASSTIAGNIPISNRIHTVETSTGGDPTKSGMGFFAGETYTFSFDTVDRTGTGQDISIFYMSYGKDGVQDFSQTQSGNTNDDVILKRFDFENVRLGETYTTTTDGQGGDWTPTVADLGGKDYVRGYFVLAETSSFSGNNIRIDNIAFNMTLCFARGTLIETPEGRKPIEQLSQGDLVMTRDCGAQPISWIGRSDHERMAMDAYVALRPVRISKGALGPNLPDRDLRVSRQHRILFSGPLCRRMFDVDEILVPANKLVVLDGVEIEEPSSHGITYFHLMLTSHHILSANGVAAESFLPGPMAVSALSEKARLDLLRHMPMGVLCDIKPSRFIPKSGKKLKSFVERWSKRAQRHGMAALEV